MRQAFTFEQGFIPTPANVSGGDAIAIGDLWSDISQSPALLKICTSLAPVVFTTVSSGGATYSDSETPSGTINSSNKTFTLANSPNPAASLILVLNGLVLKSGGYDYTLSGSTITFVNAPATGSSLLAWYRH